MPVSVAEYLGRRTNVEVEQIEPVEDKTIIPAVLFGLHASIGFAPQKIYP
ncbi:hypothetical protein SAMN04487897_11746 [Paenibacillus sp. yr247]|nr:hypothetical protein [Paenibacillus sp. yr247]SDO58288.1 hypothetical protein SAMN04487897_11746 [Paenibacillus sp. yr247]